MRKSSALLLLPALASLAGCGDAMEPTPTPTPTPAPTSTSTSDPPPKPCPILSLAGIDVAASDVYGGTPYALGYPPYAIDGCRLVYVAASASGGGGALLLRDLATGKEQTIAEATEEPRRPSIAGAWITWEATIGGAPGVRVRGESDAAVPVTIQGAFDHAGEPRAAADAVVFTAWLGPKDTDDTDIFLYRPATQEVAAVSPTPKQQRFPDISATHLAWADFSGDLDGYYTDASSYAHEADVVLFDRATSTATTRHAPGKQAFPILGATGKVAYLDWVDVQPEPKLDAYTLRIGDLGAPIEGDSVVAQISTTLLHVRPVARGPLLEWVASVDGSPLQLQRQRADLAEPPVTLPGLDGLQILGPVASDRLTLVGVRKPGAAVELRAFAR
jgi:hypothetical protein